METAAGRAAHTDAGADDAGAVLVETAGGAEDPPLTRVAVGAPATPRGATTAAADAGCGAAAPAGPRGSAALAAETGTLAREPAAVVASDAAAGADAGADTRAAATTAAAEVGCAPVWPPRPATGACCFCGDAGATAAGGITGARPSDDPTPSSAPPPYEPSL